MMKEIGGYIELDRYTGNMLYEDGIKLWAKCTCIFD